jgi:hypothetical protein
MTDQEEKPMTKTAEIVQFEPVASTAMTPMAMVAQAVASGASIETLEKLLALQERFEAGQARKAFDNAVSLAKGDIPPIVKNKQVGFESQRTGNTTSYSHETLGEIARVVDPILNKHGLSYRYKATQEGGRITVTCVLSHRDGFSEETSLNAGADDSGKKNSIQAIGSTTTYLQRYTLKLALGLATTDRDDDGARSEEPAISGAAQAAIDLIHACDTLSDLQAWKEKNDPIVQKLDRNDADTVVRAWRDRAREIREPAQ